MVCGAPGVVSTVSARVKRSIVALVAGLVVGPPVIVGAWSIAHPILRVDDATDAPMQIWIDGAPAMIVAPTSSSGEPPRLRVGWGRHRLGWSPVGATAPADE